MKYSIIGSNGFLATAITEFCNNQNFNVDLFGLEQPKVVKFNNFFEVNLITEDIDYKLICDSDVIVYAAGAGIQSNLKEIPDLIYHLNVSVPIHICNSLKQADYKGVFITFGSVFELGQTEKDDKVTEKEILSSTFKAPNDYAISKRLLTRFIADYQSEFIHWHFFIPTIYGEHENPTRLIPYTINAIKSKQKLSFTFGGQVRQYVYINDVPEIIYKALQAKLPTGLYNIASSEIYTVKEIVTLIHRIFGLEVPDDCFGTAQRTDVGMKYLALNGQKLEQFIQFASPTKVIDIIEKY